MAQQPKPAPPAAAPEKSQAPQLPFQIQLLETRIRFDANGDSRKEVHTIVKINNILGARQFGRLAFDYNRSFQSVELPFVRFSHANGGVSEILPSAISDAPASAVEKYSDFHEFRTKSVRILGLQEGDTVEYRVVITTTHSPWAPEFWVEHLFDRSGQVLEERYELQLPSSRTVQLHAAPDLPSAAVHTMEGADRDYVSHLWQTSAKQWASDSASETPDRNPDIVLTTFTDWAQLSAHMYKCLGIADAQPISAAAVAGLGSSANSQSRESLYRSVSSGVASVDLPFDATSCQPRTAEHVLSTKYGDSSEKALTLGALLAYHAHQQSKVESFSYVLYGKSPDIEHALPRPSLFVAILAVATETGRTTVFDPFLEVAPYGMVPSDMRSKKALRLTDKPCATACWTTLPRSLPFASLQRVSVSASIDKQGLLNAKVKYTMRGDNELLLREAFQQTPKDRWKEVAGLLALNDGFRGEILNVSVGDPTATETPFSVEYELGQPKFVDWTKTPVRIPALLPQIAMPDPPAKSAGANSKIDLGTPLQVETTATLRLPEGTKIQAPAGTSVARDYATYGSKYSESVNTLAAERHIRFLMREIAADRAMDYNAFLRAVQNDESQFFVLSREASGKGPAASDSAH